MLNILLQNKSLAKPLSPQSIKRALIIRYDRIGDMVVTLPMIQLLRELNPEIIIDVLASDSNASIAMANSFVHNVFIVKSNPVLFILQLFRMRKNNYNVVFACLFNKATILGLIGNFVGGRKGIKVTTNRGDKYRCLYNVLSATAAQKKSGWEKLLYLVPDVMECAIDPSSIKPYLHIPEESKQRAQTNIKTRINPSNTFCIVNLSCRNTRNQWTPKNYHTTISHILQSTGYDVLIIADNNDKLTAESLTALSSRVKIYPSTHDILEIAEVIHNAECVISPDTGVVHICSALNIPVVGLYVLDSNSLGEWLPYRIDKSAVVYSRDKQFVSTISPETVIQAFDELHKNIVANTSAELFIYS